MTILRPLTKAEYEAFKRVLAIIEEEEAKLGRPFRDHPLEPISQIDHMRTQLRAAVEGYEAANREAR